LGNAIATESSWVWWRNIKYLDISKLSLANQRLYFQQIIFQNLYRHDENLEKFNYRYFANICNKLIELSPKNSYSYYLKAILIFTFQNDFNKALYYLSEGNKKSSYINYSNEKYTLIKETAIHVNYPQVSATYLAHTAANMDYFFMVSTIRDICLAADTPEGEKICHDTGRIIEKYGRYAVEKHFGLSIQSQALNKSEKTIEEKRSELSNYIKKILAVDIYDLDEEEYLLLINAIYQTNEIEAYATYFNRNKS
jgi:hypothetical protein